ncbi:hypothetical protein BJ742DRAFT_767912 [Cladochytrium replicatum]|nr:hypothetical protein BJ742DRAFT_767912 [Cladochytrium replicatum]
MDAQYLKQTVGPVLASAIASLADHLPNSTVTKAKREIIGVKGSSGDESKAPTNVESPHLDPILFIAHYLLNHEAVLQKIEHDKAVRAEEVAVQEELKSHIRQMGERRRKMATELETEVDRREQVRAKKLASAAEAEAAALAAAEQSAAVPSPESVDTKQIQDGAAVLGQPEVQEVKPEANAAETEENGPMDENAGVASSEQPSDPPEGEEKAESIIAGDAAEEITGEGTDGELGPESEGS